MLQDAGPRPAETVEPAAMAAAACLKASGSAMPSGQLARVPWRAAAGNGRSRLANWWREAPRNLRGSIYMVFAYVFLSAMVAAVKAIGLRLPLVEVLVIRQVIIVTVLAPLFLRSGMATIRTQHPGLQILRGLFALGAMFAGFTAVLHIPLAEATAISFSQALFVTVAAVLVLKEKVGLRRWLATAVGFVGVLIMLRPSGQGLDAYALLAVLGAMFGCGITIAVRVLADSERTETIMAYQAIVLFAALGYPAWRGWIWPTSDEWLLLALIGLLGTIGQFLITRAYQIGDAAALAPLDFVRLLAATVIGYIVFAEVLTLSTAIGGGIVVAATLYTVSHNALRAPRAVLASASAAP